MSDIPGAPMSHNDPIREEVRCCVSDISILVEALHLGDCEWDGNYHCEIHDSRWLSSYERCVSVIDDLDIAERAIELVVPILTDLIAELRDEHRMDNGGYCEACDVEPFPCASGRAVNWAEARLREVSGDGDE